MGQKHEPILLTAWQVASLLSVAEVTIRTWISRRRAAALKPGSSLRIPAADVERLLAEAMVVAWTDQGYADDGRMEH
jgi:excisionase family DNA binding protein